MNANVEKVSKNWSDPGYFRILKFGDFIGEDDVIESTVGRDGKVNGMDTLVIKTMKRISPELIGSKSYILSGDKIITGEMEYKTKPQNKRILYVPINKKEIKKYNKSSDFLRGFGL